MEKNQEMDELPPIPDMNKEILNDNNSDMNNSFLLSKYMKENEELKEQLNELLENKEINNNDNNDNDDDEDNTKMKEELEKYANYIHELENTINVKDEQINKLEQQLATDKINEDNNNSNNNNNNTSNDLITPRSSPNNSGSRIMGSGKRNSTNYNTVESETETDPTNEMLEKIKEYEVLYNNLQTENDLLNNRIKELENAIIGDNKKNGDDSLIIRENNCDDVERLLDKIKKLEEENQYLTNENEALLNNYADMKMKCENIERRVSSTGPATNNDEDNIDPLVLEKIKELKNQISLYEEKFNQITEEIPNHGINIDKYRQVLEDNDYLKAELLQNEKERKRLLNIIHERLDEIKEKAKDFTSDDFDNLVAGYNELIDNYTKTLNNNNNNINSKNVSTVTQKIQLMNIIEQLSNIINIKYNGDGYSVNDISSFLLNVIEYITQLHYEVEKRGKEGNGNEDEKDKEIERLNCEVKTLLSNTTCKQNYTLLQENKDLKMKLNELLSNDNEIGATAGKDLFYSYYHSSEDTTEYTDSMRRILYNLRNLKNDNKRLNDLYGEFDSTISIMDENRLKIKESLMQLNNEIQYIKEKLRSLFDNIEAGNIEVSDECLKLLRDFEKCICDVEEYV